MLTGTFGDRRVVRFAVGEQVVDGLLRYLAEQEIGFSFVGAIGGVRRVRLGYWDVDAKGYATRELEEQLEVLSLLGDASRKEGKPHLHVHAVFGRSDFTTVGGHVQECEASPTLELWLRTEGTPVQRVHDEATGLDLLDLGGPH
jgi:predicted DNA-binding protein with PD1-like motif